MASESALLALYALPLALIWGGFGLFRKLTERRVVSVRREAEDAGLTEPASLHPVIDPVACIGCGACVTACPEGQILGLVGGKAELIEPTQCIGHGACAAACPLQAIDLVFGTAKRGVDIPHVEPDFQTNVPGIYIAGELGGMGLIRNAIEQGRQAIEEIGRASKSRSGMDHDVIIIGAGPTGLSASLGAMKAGLKFRTLEQDTLGGTVAHFPRGKLVMTAPADLPMHGKVNFKEVSKEELMAFWQSVVDKTGLEVDTGQRVDAIEAIPGGFRVETPTDSFETSAVLLAIGRRGTPRKLDVPGEDQSKVVYRLTDPEQYRGKNVLVVGGGDSALEAATSIAAEEGTSVTLSYRSGGFSRAKLKNRKKVEQMQAEGRLDVQLSSQVAEILESTVKLNVREDTIERENDAVIICAGGILPTPFLKSIGIEVETKHGKS